jgi:hypothetical protein
MKRSHLVVLPAAVLSLFALTAPARAAAWGFTLTPYMWATGVGVDADLAGRQVVDKDISVNDLVKDLDTIFQMKLEVTYGRFGLYADGFDVNLSNDKNGVTPAAGRGLGGPELHGRHDDRGRGRHVRPDRGTQRARARRRLADPERSRHGRRHDPTFTRRHGTPELRRARDAG